MQTLLRLPTLSAFSGGISCQNSFMFPPHLLNKLKSLVKWAARIPNILKNSNALGLSKRLSLVNNILCFICSPKSLKSYYQCVPGVYSLGSVSPISAVLMSSVNPTYHFASLHLVYFLGNSDSIAISHSSVALYLLVSRRIAPVYATTGPTTGP